MGLFTKTPEEKQAQEAALRQSREADAAVVALFDEFAHLPICVELSNLEDGERGLVNAINGMLLVECTEVGLTGRGPKQLELRTLPNSTSGNYSTSFFTSLTKDEAERLLSVWSYMAKGMQ